MSKQKSCAKSLIITNDEQLDPEDLNPFSFREFLRWKNQDQDPDQLVQLQSAAEEEEEDEGGQEVSVTFDPEEDGWGRSFQSGVDGTLSFCTEEDEEDEEEETRFSSKPEDQQGAAAGGRGGAAGGRGAAAGGRGGAAGGRGVAAGGRGAAAGGRGAAAGGRGAAAGGRGAAAGGRGAAENYEGDDETSIAEAVTSCRRSSQTHIQQMKEENVSLRRSIKELQRRSDANELRVLELSEELVQRRRQEEKEAQDLESMVQSVEQNLHLMTKRALKAEGCVSKLKMELQQLQSENDSLKAADSEIVMTMRHNAQVASEYLNKTASHAHFSIRQLLGEAESLCLVSQLLKSIDKISES